MILQLPEIGNELLSVLCKGDYFVVFHQCFRTGKNKASPKLKLRQFGLYTSISNFNGKYKMHSPFMPQKSFGKT